MKISALIAAVLLAAPAHAQTRAAVPVTMPRIGISVPILSAPPSLAVSALSPAAALAVAAPVLLSPARLAIPIAVPTAAAPLPAKVAVLSAGISKVVAALAEDTASGATALTAGRDIETLLTGTGLSAPSATDAASSPEELSYAVDASQALAARADDLGASKGLKMGRMSGADFLGLLEEARGSAPAAPMAAAAAAARKIETQAIRVVRALVPAGKPLSESVRRALAVWHVFDQEIGLAASKGTLDAVVAEATLFASQVEDSVDAQPAAPAALAPYAPEVHPEDPNGYASVSVPGSIFGWKPIEESPSHGLPPLDALIRRVLAEKKSPYAKGFELPGAASREDARVHFYGERHTDGALISANMRRLIADARTGNPVIVLVEGYTGWSLRGWPAIKYLADRGLDPDTLTNKGITSGEVEVRGWDVSGNYDDSKHPLLQHHMERSRSF